MKTLRIFLIIIVTGIMAALVIYPERYIQSVQDGLKLFVISVLPALFPFFFFSKILSALDVASSMGRFIKKPLNKLFHSPPVGG
jgi:nucleoside recognition membrane protein YjiH